MSEPIEELRAQRELIRKHLDWLDAQIKDVEDAGSGHDQSDPAENHSEQDAQTESSTPRAIEKSSKPNPVKNVQPNEIEEKIMEYSGGSEIQRAKIGCFVFFAVITLLFLFLLFGLPYLLD